MKYIKLTYLFFLFIICSYSFKGISQESTGVVVDEIIVRVDDYIVLRTELESTYLDILSRGERISGNTKCAVLKDLITNIHQIGMIKIGANEGIKSLLTESEFQLLENLSTKLEIQSISMVWQMLNKGLNEVQSSFSPISSLEMLIIRLIYLEDSPNPEDLIKNLSRSIDDTESDKSINPKVKEIIDFFPGTEVENID